MKSLLILAAFAAQTSGAVATPAILKDDANHETAIETAKKPPVSIIYVKDSDVLVGAGSKYDLKQEVLNYSDLENPRFKLQGSHDGLSISNKILTVNKNVAVGTSFSIRVTASNTHYSALINGYVTADTTLTNIEVIPNLNISLGQTLTLQNMVSNYDALMNPFLSFKDATHDGFEIIGNSLVASDNITINSVALTIDAQNATSPVDVMIKVNNPSTKPESVQIQPNYGVQLTFAKPLTIQDLVTNYDQLVDPSISFDTFGDYFGYYIHDNVLYATSAAKEPNVSIIINAKNSFNGQGVYLNIVCVDVDKQPIKLTQLDYTLKRGSTWTVNDMIVNPQDLKGLNFQVVEDYANGKMYYDKDFTLHVESDVAQGAKVVVKITATNSREEKLVNIYADTTIKLTTMTLQLERGMTYNFNDYVENIGRLVNPRVAISGYGIWGVDVISAKGLVMVSNDAYGSGTLTVSADNALTDASLNFEVIVK